MENLLQTRFATSGEKRTMSQEAIATIGFGIEIRASSIPGGGNGLWTTRRFSKHELITEYCGPIIDFEKAKQLRAQNRHSHIRVLNAQFRYIDGIKQPQQGTGGASFANDARDKTKNNAVFVQKFDSKLGRDRVFLKATRDLDPATEVLVNYGNGYWRASKQKPASSQHEQQPHTPPRHEMQAAGAPCSAARAARALARSCGYQQRQQPQEQEQLPAHKRPRRLSHQLQQTQVQDQQQQQQQQRQPTQQQLAHKTQQQRMKQEEVVQTALAAAAPSWQQQQSRRQHIPQLAANPEAAALGLMATGTAHRVGLVMTQPGSVTTGVDPALVAATTVPPSHQAAVKPVVVQQDLLQLNYQWQQQPALQGLSAAAQLGLDLGQRQGLPAPLACMPFLLPGQAPQLLMQALHAAPVAATPNTRARLRLLLQQQQREAEEEAARQAAGRQWTACTAEQQQHQVVSSAAATQVLGNAAATVQEAVGAAGVMLSGHDPALTEPWPDRFPAAAVNAPAINNSAGSSRRSLRVQQRHGFNTAAHADSGDGIDGDGGHDQAAGVGSRPPAERSLPSQPAGEAGQVVHSDDGKRLRERAPSAADSTQMADPYRKMYRSRCGMSARDRSQLQSGQVVNPYKKVYKSCRSQAVLQE